jgi:hypothetical protein
LYEVWTGKWKGGLQIHQAIVEEVKPWDLVRINQSHTILF